MRQVAALLLLSTASVLLAQDDRELAALHRIKVEAFDNSKVMDHLQSISDRYGPRLTASPEWFEAAEWVMQAMKSWGLSNVHEEKWGPFGRSWSLESCNLDMIAPRYSHLVAYPLAWSAPTKGIETGDLMYAPMDTDHWYDFSKFREGFDKYKAQWHGKLKGKIVLVSDAKKWPISTRPVFRRYTAEDLATIGNAPEPIIRRHITIDELKIPEQEDEIGK